MSLQHVVGLLLIPLVAVAGQRWFGRVAALLAATLVSIAPSFFAIEDDALPDFFLAVFLTIAALAIAAATDPSRSNRRYAILAGAAIATIVLIKPVGWVLLLAMPATILLCDQHPRRALRLGMVTAATTLALLSPWVIHDLIRYQSPVLSGGGGIALFNRVFAVDKQPLPERNAIEKQLAAELRSAPPESRSTFVALDALNRMGLAREATDIMGALARDGIRADPLGWWWRSIKLLDRYPSEIKPGDFYWTPLLARTSEATGAAVWLWKLGVRLGDYWYVLTMAGLTSLLALFLGPAKWRRGAAATLVTGGLMAFATIASHGGLPRYSLELAPLLWLVSISGAVLLAKAAIRAAKDRSA